MKNLSRLLDEGRKTEWGIVLLSENESSDLLGRAMLVSNKGVSLIDSAFNQVQCLVDMLESAPELKVPKSSHGGLDYTGSIEQEEYLHIVHIKRNLPVAVKVYDEGGGLEFFLSLMKGLKEKHFDTLTPYLAARGYILTDLIPDIPTCGEFVQMHPKLKEEVIIAIRNVQKKANIRNGVSFDGLAGAIPANFYISRYNPKARIPEEKFRFFIVDAGYKPE